MTIAAFSQSEAPIAHTRTAPAPDVNLIPQSMERVQQQNAALSRPHQVTRHSKAFHGDDAQPSAEITPQISFTPPNTTTFNILQASGNPRGERIVRDILEQETEPATERDNRDISRKNYDFLFSSAGELRASSRVCIPRHVTQLLGNRQSGRETPASTEQCAGAMGPSGSS